MNILQSPIEYLTGISAQRGELLRKELNISTFSDLLNHFPYRHVDKTKVDKIAALKSSIEYAYVAGTLISLELITTGKTRRLVGILKDNTGIIELVWFQGIAWVQKTLHTGHKYFVFGKPGFFLGKPQMAHPDLENFNTGSSTGKAWMEPVYPTTEKLRAKYLTGQSLAKFTKELMAKLSVNDINENLPDEILVKYKFVPRFLAYRQIHFPANEEQYKQALRRLKFEELFFAQLRLGQIRLQRHRFSRGQVFNKVGDLFHTFYNKYLPFELTHAQKKVLKEIRKDTAAGKQMNRLLQGDVGSGKTMIALLSMLIAADNHFQSVLMAPTEILALQHFENIKTFLSKLPIQVELLTGSTTAANRKKILKACENGAVQILIGTHAVIENKVKFQNLGFAVVDEQHKFGVEQRAKLWEKNLLPPHILVMTATPIPRTLALTAYGDLDYSVMDELPPGRKPITTFHRNETARPQVMDFIKEEITKGRQVYIIYPLIEESSKLDYENLMKGFEEVKAFFPEPKYWISMLHGRQPTDQKDTNMQRFVQGDTQIMVATTVIEVGVNVPNASVMLVESAERFGLSQLHQLRGRVGRGAEKSFCILLTGQKVGKDARERMQIMETTNDGFLIAEKDLELRGPGQIDGTRQSGALDFKLASIVNDKEMLEAARNSVEIILELDPELVLKSHERVKQFLLQQKAKTRWSKVG
ncbi:MAG: ATP-dependent DNA helicase RecG [Chitinophagaceae bacterium]|nr:ATP-dependent DNA helicase RecG [Chitinophagaceae bacterium]MBK7087600.1 ATP-dependent DNA helicase RecG [Chitinophagaceae bacterium]MBK7346373.1 ATP-dependent DNA helicase RecG [Chitinophagaceae bacterium]MBK7735891.1 ATP-dependent DNA helicase RecG [Chitinophagaceae bacterium]MBK9959145.1 ATP-dependent DNA helicase RecG [Chitinophagaceae bacterium]